MYDRIYFDNNATTRVLPEVLDVFHRQLVETFGNPSSIHKEGQMARRVLEESRDAVAFFIGATPRDLVFTSGGSESNSAAILGFARTLGGCFHAVTTAIEHPSVLEAFAQLERAGWRVTRVAPRASGVVDAGEFASAITSDTKLASMMLVNNETGVIQPVDEAARICRERNIFFHCDAVQAAGKIAIDVERLPVDALTIAGHKLHAPKGIGALWLRRGTTLEPIVVGGAQERRRRAGTENAPLAAAFARAVTLAQSDAARVESVRRLRDELEARLARELSFVTINGADAPRVFNTTNVLFRGLDAEGIVIDLDLHGVAVSTGSACSSGRVEPSHVLLAMGLSEEDARSSVRLSLSRFTTPEEVERTAKLIVAHAPRHTRTSPAGERPAMRRSTL